MCLLSEARIYEPSGHVDLKARVGSGGKKNCPKALPQDCLYCSAELVQYALHLGHVPCNQGLDFDP